MTFKHDWEKTDKQISLPSTIGYSGVRYWDYVVGHHYVIYGTSCSPY